MEKEEKCTCGAGNKIVLACSGASDVGCISDKVARMMQLGGKRQMSCLALVGAGIEASIANFKTKDVLVIDGCPTACGKKILDKQGIENYQHLVVTDLGFKKGESPASNENVEAVFNESVKF